MLLIRSVILSIRENLYRWTRGNDLVVHLDLLIFISVFQLEPLEKGCIVFGDGADPHGSRGCDAVETRVATGVLDEHAGQASVAGSVVNSLQCFQRRTLKTNLGSDAIYTILFLSVFWCRQPRAQKSVSRLTATLARTHIQIGTQNSVNPKSGIV